MALTRLQEQALSCMLSGENVFLTGNAGTGKSFVLSEFINRISEEKNLVICAPSGIAALNVGGVTMHRAFHMPLTVCTGKVRKSKVVEAADIIIIDEISMCRMDMFDYVGRVITEISEKRMAHRAKNGKTEPIQLICVGDFYQLPPVLQDKERAVLCEHYGRDIGKAYAFQSEYWDRFGFHTISLQEIIRQDEPEFIENLNKARVGDPTCIRYFAEHSRKSRMKDAVTVCGTNKDADAINARALAKLPGRAQKFQSQVTGEVKPSDKTAPDELSLKVGARVILLANDAVDDQYRNGTIAEVTALARNRVDLVNISTGEEIRLSPYTWRVNQYVVGEDGAISQEEIGTVKQFPLKLAYAVTIHKSQGQTYDMVNLNPRAWDDGQLYVALSRVRSIKKLHLTSPILRQYLITSRAVKDFYRKVLGEENFGEPERIPLYEDMAPSYEYSPSDNEDVVRFGTRFEESQSISEEDQAYFDFLFGQAPPAEELPWTVPDNKETEGLPFYEKKSGKAKNSRKKKDTVTLEVPAKYESLFRTLLEQLEALDNK